VSGGFSLHTWQNVRINIQGQGNCRMSSPERANSTLSVEKYSRLMFGQIRLIDFSFLVKFLGAALAVIFAKDANEHAFFLGFSSYLPCAARLNVNHFTAGIAINRVFYH
jgi:hypothetical protein